MLLFAALVWLFQFRQESNDFGEEFSEFKRLGHSIHLSLQSLVGGALVTDLTEPANAMYW